MAMLLASLLLALGSWGCWVTFTHSTRLYDYEHVPVLSVVALSMAAGIVTARPIIRRGHGRNLLAVLVGMGLASFFGQGFGLVFVGASSGAVHAAISNERAVVAGAQPRTWPLDWRGVAIAVVYIMMAFLTASTVRESKPYVELFGLTPQSTGAAYRRSSSYRQIRFDKKCGCLSMALDAATRTDEAEEAVQFCFEREVRRDETRPIGQVRRGCVAQVSGLPD